MRVDAAGAAAALQGDGWGCAVPVWDVLRLRHKNAQLRTTIAKLIREFIDCLMSKTAAKTYDDGLILFYSVLDSDALDLLIKTLHAVTKARG